jgi:hypothetical protein
MEKLTVAQLIEQKNKIEALIIAKENNLTESNTPIFYTECLNLLRGVGLGEGYREGDHYAPERYYSSIDGIKNIRIYDSNIHFNLPEKKLPVIIVKVDSPKGYLIPKKCKVK